MTNYIEKIYHKLVKKKEEPKLSSEDYEKICNKVEDIFNQFYDEILGDPVINNKKEIYNIAAEIFSSLSRLDTILRLEHTLREFRLDEIRNINISLYD